MSVDKENASLVLNTRDAVASDQKATHTWNNINLESLLEGMYDKYDSFNLCLSFSMTSTTTVNATFNSLNDRNVLIYVSGLPFKAQCYKSGTNRISNQTVMGYILFESDTSTSVIDTNYQSFYIATFTKNTPVCNITIQLRRADGTLPNVTNDLPNIIYCFDIYGVEPKTKIIDNRIK
jgi:hypothetical protein